MSNVILYSSRACPFAHRTRLVLEHKKITFQLTEIDLRNKPADYASISLYGKVPALEHDGRRVVESAIINEYLDEVFPEPRLLPEGPYEKARARILIDYANTRFVGAFGGLLRAREPSAREPAREALLAALEFLEKNLFSDGAAPFSNGPSPGLVDFTFYPWFERWSALSHYRSISLEAYPRLDDWRHRLAQLPAAQAIANSHDFYVERYARQAA